MTQTSNSTPQWVVLARILRPQGRKGEVLADLFTDFPDRFVNHSQMCLAPAGFAEGAGPSSAAHPATATAEPQPANITSHWLPVGRNAGRIVLHFAGVDSITQAEALTGMEVIVPLAHRITLGPDATYISDLVGCTLYDRDQPLGVVDAVNFPTAPDGSRLHDAAPLLAIATPGGVEALIPFARAYLLAIDTKEKAIRMSLPDGLVDLNTARSDSDDNG